MKNYFKNFSIMFIMILAIVGVGVFQDGIMANAATVGQVLSEPENGWVRHDDTDSNISYEGSWYHYQNIYGFTNQTYSGTQAYSNASNSGAGFKIRFNMVSDKLRIIGYSAVNTCKDVRVTIDGNPIDDIDTGYGDAYGIHPCLQFSIENLPYEEHSIELENISPEQWTFDAIDIDSNGELKPYSPILTKTEISLNKSLVDLKVDDSQQLTATTTPAGVQVTWTSSDSNVATVDSTGKVTGVKEGTCTITATTADGLTATCAVTVTSKTAEPTNPNPDPTNSENIVNIAHAKGDNTNNAGGDVTIIFHGAADTTLSVVKTADVKDVWVGDNFTYTIVVTNTGTKTAKAVVVNDPAPNHIDFLVNGVTSTQGKIDPSSTSKNIIVNVGDIPPLGTVTIKIPATVIL
ncbi:Ig-like domain-containing protein [Clostridium beijerinckii]|uniref:Ig-like domain-containing protein n=1 Tax=Clostridium beijerinckii TaxID=1520 RepID=UPI00222653DE|nr:Ig-like domain-containing protein [Clostridium beijerinckii]UYZ37288.1 Ig-like domain-containing protein [Clostridium beijerinckii]